MPQFCRNRKRTEIRDRLKGVIFIVAVVEQEQNIKSKSKEKCKALRTNIILCGEFLLKCLW